MCNFYVYAHRKLSDSSVFYIGKGSGNRAYSKTSRNKHWINTVNIHGYYVDFIESDISEEQAFELESFLISEIGIDNLCNLTLGGDGISGYRHSVESIRKISYASSIRVFSEESNKKKSEKLLGMKHTDSTRKKMSISKIGTKISSDAKIKISNALKGRVPHNKGKKTSVDIKEKISKSAKLRKRIECTHCFRSIPINNYNQWHGDNCKLNNSRVN